MKGLASWTISLFCLLAILIKGRQGFFIKHSVSGLCLKVEDTYFNGNLNDWGANYYVKFYDGCLHTHAQFRYVDDTFVHNIEQIGTFLGRRYGPENDRYLNRYIVYRNLSSTASFVRTPDFALRHKSGTLEIYDGTYCATPSKTTKPFDGAYPVKTTTCDKDLQKFTFGSVTNKDSAMTDVNCASSQKMEVVKAEFGEFSDGKPFVYNNDTKCSSFALCFVKTHCHGKISCNMAADRNLFKPNQYPKTKQLYMEYNCVDTPGPAVMTVFKIRLSLSPYRGSIEVFNGTTWIKANDKTWSKEKEVALCHHLGFINTKSGSGAVKETIPIGQKLASGDLYCCGTQPTNTSCCAQLVSSTLTQSAKIPNVKCLICNEPLLEDTVKFPNGIFSASEGDGHEARVTNNGWCPTSSGSKYLQIDLQREYYITYIATFGDKAQTKWLESYSLQYSRTSAGLSSSTAKTIATNDHTYQASVVRLDISRARYLKIIPKQGKEFCLRVELCGRAVPDPVQNIVFDTINARSALVSWSLPQNDQQSHVTYFLVFLNDTKKAGNVTRSGDKNQYTMDKLRPYRNYKVTIEAANVYGAGDGISKTFKTKEAAPDGPPSNVAVVFRNSSSLNVSWQPPSDKSVWNGIITRYKLCNSAAGNKPESCVFNITRTSYVMTKLKPGTEYLVKVFAGTKIDYGALSDDINATTNQEPVKPSKKTYYSLGISLKKPRDKVQSVLVIVQAANISSKTTDEYKSNELKPFMNGSSAPYVTAGLNASGLRRTFVIGDGMWYNLTTASYFNQPLKEDTDYIVFLRYIESKDIYSTEWSESVKVFKRPSAPQITRIVSYGTNGLKISWMQPSLPKDQTAINHIVAYRSSSNILVTKETGSGSSTYILGCLEYKKKYFISVQTVTQAGESKPSNEMSRTTNSEPVLPPKKRNNSYTVTLRKPKDKSIQNVNLIVLQVQSESTIPTPPEEIKPVKFSDVRKQDDNVAFIAMEINVADFKENTIKVTLQVSDAKKRRRRALESNVVLDQDLVYRAAQFNYDTSGTSYPSYWSDSFVFSKASSTGTKSQLSDEGCSKTVLYVVISILLVIIAVLLVVVIYVCLRRPKLQPGVKDSVVNVENKTFSDGIYDEVQNPNPDSNLGNINPSAYEALDLRKKEQDQNTYQSLVKPTV